jgi:lipid II:glycine glycyltransferase (peptidoglycan interpeptide bridge formation enzyme)
MTKGKRRDVRAAQRTGLSDRRAESEADIVDVYFGLHVETRRRLGVPSQPKQFFRLLWRRVLQTGRGFALIVEDGNVPVAGGIFLRANGTLVYKYGAADAARRAQLPTDLLLWTAVEEACERGDSVFDFGRSDLHAAGLRSFKARWGAAERPLVYSAIGDGAAVAVSGAGAGGIVGRVLRHSPTWVTRATGELLYRYAT